MFKSNNFLQRLKNNKKELLISIIVGGLFVTTIMNSDNMFLGLKQMYSASTGTTISMDISNKNNSKEFKTDTFKGVIFDTYSSGFGKKRKTVTNMFTTSINKKTNDIEIEEIGQILDLFTQKIIMSKNMKKESNFFSSFPLVSRFFNMDINLKLPENVQSVINVDMSKKIPQLTYLDNKGILTITSISRYGIFNDAKVKFVTKEQAKSLNVDAASISKDDISYNGRLLDRLSTKDNAKYFLLPKDFKNIVSLTLDKNRDKVFSYKTKNGELKVITIGDLNFNANYIITDKNDMNIYSDTKNNIEQSTININALNKIMDDNKGLVKMKLDVDKKDIEKIISIDKNGNSLEVTYKDKNGKIYLKEIGMTIGLLEANIEINI